MKLYKVYKVLFILHVFIGIGAIFGGMGAVIEPDGPMGTSPDMLKNGPFNNFLIPGLFLLLVNGVLNVVAAFFVRRRFKYQGYFSGIMGVIMMMWIIIQCYILQAINILHIIFFVLGLIVSIFALILSIRTKLFPFNLLRIFEK